MFIITSESGLVGRWTYRRFSSVTEGLTCFKKGPREGAGASDKNRMVNQQGRQWLLTRKKLKQRFSKQKVGKKD